MDDAEFRFLKWVSKYRETFGRYDPTFQNVVRGYLNKPQWERTVDYVDKKTEVIKNLYKERKAQREKETYTQEGEGLLEDVTRQVKRRVKEAVSGEMAKNIKRRVEVAFKGRKTLPTRAQATLNSWGNSQISNITINRRPVPTWIEKAFKLITAGDIDRVKRDYGYDRLYHLTLIADTNRGTFVLEKNGDDNVVVKKGNVPAGEQIQFPVNKPLTLNDFVMNTEKYMGDSFLKYDSNTNNCQKFVTSLLKANGLGNQEVFKFINQDIDALYKQSTRGKVVEKIAKVATDIGGVAERALTGQGNKLKSRRK